MGRIISAFFILAISFIFTPNLVTAQLPTKEAVDEAARGLRDKKKSDTERIAIARSLGSVADTIEDTKLRPAVTALLNVAGEKTIDKTGKPLPPREGKEDAKSESPELRVAALQSLLQLGKSHPTLIDSVLKSVDSQSVPIGVFGTLAYGRYAGNTGEVITISATVATELLLLPEAASKKNLSALKQECVAILQRRIAEGKSTSTTYPDQSMTLHRSLAQLRGSALTEEEKNAEFENIKQVMAKNKDFMTSATALKMLAANQADPKAVMQFLATQVGRTGGSLEFSAALAEAMHAKGYDQLDEVQRLEVIVGLTNALLKESKRQVAVILAGQICEAVGDKPDELDELRDHFVDCWLQQDLQCGPCDFRAQHKHTPIAEGQSAFPPEQSEAIRKTAIYALIAYAKFPGAHEVLPHFLTVLASTTKDFVDNEEVRKAKSLEVAKTKVQRDALDAAMAEAIANRKRDKAVAGELIWAVGEIAATLDATNKEVAIKAVEAARDAINETEIRDVARTALESLKKN